MNKAEFTQHVRQMERRLYRVARTMLSKDVDCEDAVQEALLKAWSHLGDLRQPQFFETWLIRILINECRNLYRRHPSLEVELPESLSIKACDSSPLFDAMMELPRKYRIILELHYIEGYKTREVAKMMSTTESTVKWRLAHGRKILRQQLRKEI